MPLQKQKRGHDPFTALGQTQLPNALVQYASRLGLKVDECRLTACILMFKHTPDRLFPSQERLAQLLGKSERTLRRRVEAIEQKGLVWSRSNTPATTSHSTPTVSATLRPCVLR